MRRPVLDSRNAGEILEEVRRLAKSYTPEWRFEGARDDPGAAIAEIFSLMFSQTIDRYNEVPEKVYLAFLDMIGAREASPVPAEGVMVFTPQAGIEAPVTVEKGTQVFAVDDEGGNIVYETDTMIQARDTEISGLYYIDSDSDVIREYPLEGIRKLFSAFEGTDIQRHRMFISHNDVFSGAVPMTFSVEVKDALRANGNEIASALGDGKLRWSYQSGGEQREFDEVTVRGGILLLKKDNDLEIDTSENGHLGISCQGHPEGNITLGSIDIASEPLAWVAAGEMYYNDTPVYAEEGGYCFGVEPVPYDLFYFRMDPLLSKRGATATLRFDITSIVDDPGEQEPQYEYGEAIIDKNRAVGIKPDDMYVSRVIWEYYNGTGWSDLRVNGSKNPFAGKDAGVQELTFTLPDDIAAVEVNSINGLFLRARVAEVMNRFSTYQRKILPFIHGVYGKWQYNIFEKPDYIETENNGNTVRIDDPSDTPVQGFEAFELMEGGVRAMYFCFDRRPEALPLSIYMQIFGRARMEKIVWEAYGLSGFRQIRTVDMTDNLSHSGTIFLYLGTQLLRTEFFGREGYWVRVMRQAPDAFEVPQVGGIYPNAVNARQINREPTQYFDTAAYEPLKRIQVTGTPLLETEVWVNELSERAGNESRRLAEEMPSRVRLETEDHRVTACWVLWKKVDDLSFAGSLDRAYVVDPYSGIITFGDGKNGMIPPGGDHNIEVNYVSGGGERGNQPVNAVNSALVGLPYISSVTNITPMRGGTKRISLEKFEYLGSRKIAHRGRASSVRDFEDVIMEKFPQVSHVRCFSGYDEQGESEPGNVTVVLQSVGADQESTLKLCSRVRDYLYTVCSMTMAQEGRIHVRGVIDMRVNAHLTVELIQIDRAAETQQAVIDAINELIENRWRTRPIGEQIRPRELRAAVAGIENVAYIRQLMLEGVYEENGRIRSIPLESTGAALYSFVENGEHNVSIV